MAKKISTIYGGLWLLVPEHLRLGSWELLRQWSGENDKALAPRLALQLVHEAALCVSGIRPLRSLCHQGFEVINGLVKIATDKEIHELLDRHTVAEAKHLQIVLGQYRWAHGHYLNNIYAFDPHRIRTYSKRIMPMKKASPDSRAEKVLQSFFCLDAISGQPVASTIGPSGKSASAAAIELIDMVKIIIPQKGLILADTEHVTVELLQRVLGDHWFEILMPMAKRKKVIEYFQKLEYDRKWAGYALAHTKYQFKEMDQPINMIVQRTGEIASEYQYKPFVSSSFENEKDLIKLVSEEFPMRWTIEEFFNFEASMGWNRAATLNLNIRYGKMSLALIAQAVAYQLRQKLPKPYRTWTAEHLSNSVFCGISSDISVKNDRIIVTLYNVPEYLGLKKYYEGMPEKLEAEGIDPRVPWLYNFKVDYRFK